LAAPAYEIRPVALLLIHNTGQALQFVGSHSERLSTAAFSSRSQLLEIVGKAQPACRVN
jgi:hypothetical protein